MFVIYTLSIALEAIPWGTRAVSSELVTSVAFVKYLNADLIINIWEENRNGEKQGRIGLKKRYEALLRAPGFH